MRRNTRILAVLVLNLALLTGCAAVKPEADLSLTPELLQQRQLQTRRFDTADELRILKICAALLQDIGFNIDESDTQLGIITGSKQRDATEVKQWAVYIVAAFVGVQLSPDKDQIMRVCVTTRPIGAENKQVSVRVVFERIVYDIDRNISRMEGLNDPQIFQSFFEKLSKALFLEAHEL